MGDFSEQNYLIQELANQIIKGNINMDDLNHLTNTELKLLLVLFINKLTQKESIDATSLH